MAYPSTPAQSQYPEPNFLVRSEQFDQSLWQSLRRQFHEWRHPEKLPPLQLTSKPVPVKVILETSQLDTEQKVIACVLSKAAGAA